MSRFMEDLSTPGLTTSALHPASQSSDADRRPKQPFDPAQLLARLWKQNLPLMRERFDLLESAAQDAHAGMLTPLRRTEAANTAHKLAGSLGMFGFPQGTEIARQLEMLLEAVAPPDAALLLRLSADLRSAVPL